MGSYNAQFNKSCRELTFEFGFIIMQKRSKLTYRFLKLQPTESLCHVTYGEQILDINQELESPLCWVSITGNHSLEYYSKSRNLRTSEGVHNIIEQTIVPTMHQRRSQARTQEITMWIVISRCNIYLNLNWKCSRGKWIELHSFLLWRFIEFMDSSCNNETQFFLQFHKVWVTHGNKYWRNCSIWLTLLHSPHDFNHHISELTCREVVLPTPKDNTIFCKLVLITQNYCNAIIGKI